jgi:ribosome-binding ATPase YchF (GTP1/OBG family)
MVIWYIFPALVCCNKENLATLVVATKIMETLSQNPEKCIPIIAQLEEALAHVL